MEQIKHFYTDKNILITGGGGYLGSKLAEALCAYQCSIYLLDIRFNSISENLIKTKPNVFKLLADITVFNEVNQQCQIANPHIIFHFASLLNRERDFSLYNDLYEVNVKGSLNLLNALKGIAYLRFIYASTSEVYGNTNTSPFNEEQLPQPASPYSLTKLMAELLVQNFSQIYNKPFAIYRIFNFYGTLMPDNFFISQLEKALNNNVFFEMTEGEQKRDYLSIDILCNYILSASSKKNTDNDIVNICSGKGQKIKSIALDFASKMNKTHLLKIGALPYRKNEIWELVGDNSKLKKIIESKNKNDF